MKSILLTSDIVDGRIVAEKLLRSGSDLAAIVYEPAAGKKRFIERLKADIAVLLLAMRGKLRYMTFEEMARNYCGLQVRFTENINSVDAIDFIKTLKPDLLVVVGTRKLDCKVFNAAPLGAINLHSGILPFYRGSDSEFWALYNNDPDRIGVTIHFVNEKLDGGNIILQEKQKIKSSDSIGSLRIKNIYLGAEKIKEAMNLLESGTNASSVQNNAAIGTYRKADPEIRKHLKERLSQFRKRSSVRKVFKGGPAEITEEVARIPLIKYMEGMNIDYPNIFCLRIDADEYHDGTIGSYGSLFKKYNNAVTVFVNVNNFYAKRDLIKEWHMNKIDIQSHAFYHHTYGDYASNRHNIRKARLFLEELGIPAKGFVSPFGNWNIGLTKALEDEGYQYSSEFSYDYLGLPTYPYLGDSVSKILQIPVFPLAPELFLERGIKSIDQIVAYYRNAIDEMEACGLPVIIYAHTSSHNEIPIILNSILEYALSDKGLSPANMTSFYEWWKNKPAGTRYPKQIKRTVKIPDKLYFGEILDVGNFGKVKSFVKKTIDFERVTPAEELRCSRTKKVLKLFVRKLWYKNKEVSSGGLLQK